MRVTSLKKPVTTPMAVAQEWVAAALTDDQMVVELLLRLKHAGTVESENPAANLPLMRWGARQRRSRPSRLSVGVGGFLKKETDSARASPMTPLCWSGGSGSSGSTCPSDTSRQSSCSTSTGSGSKAVHATNEITSSCSNRSKKNKTFLERLDLEKNIASVQATYEERSAKNQSFKRIKLEFNSDRVKTIPISICNLDESRQRRRLPSEEKGFFFLPDLNMTPTEDDGTLYGTS